MLIPQAIVQAASAGALTQIQDSTLGADGTFDFTSIPATYNHLLGMYRLRGAAATSTVSVFMRLNNDSGATYQQINTQATGAANQNQGLLGSAPGDSATANNVAAGLLFVPDYTPSTWFKIFVGSTAFWNEGTTSGMGVQGNMWDSTAAVNRIQLLPSSGSWKAGSRFTLWGVV